MIFIEGIPGSGKTTVSGKLKEYYETKGQKVKLYNEGDLHPIDLAWCALFSKQEYDELLKDYPEHEEIIRKNSLVEEDQVIVAYTKMGFHPGENPVMDICEEKEIYQGKVSLEEFKTVHLRRWKAFVDQVDEETLYIMECIYFQNHIVELMGQYDLSDEVIIKYLADLMETVLPLNPKLIYLTQDDMRETINRVAVERLSPDHSKWRDWIDIVIEYTDGMPFSKARNQSGLEGTFHFFEHRKTLELKTITLMEHQLPALDIVTVNNSDYDVEKVMDRIVLSGLRDLIDEKKFSGVVMIRRNDEVVFESATGYADRANKRENKLDTKFGIASGTKTFTSTAISMLIDQGKLELDSKALPFIDYDYPTYDQSVTVHQLMCHRSGLPDYYDEEEIEDFDNFTVSKPWCEMFEPKDYFEVFPQKEMKAKPDETFSYNNSGYVMLAAIIAKVSGEKYTEFVDEHVFAKAGMKDSGFYAMNRLPENTANGYIDFEGGYRTNIYNLPIVGGGDGGAFTTAPDVLNFWDALMNGELISKELVEGNTNVIPVREGKKAYDKYGRGFWFEPGLIIMEGCDAGVSFQSGFHREKNLQYVVLSNTTDGAWDITEKIKELI